MGLDRGVLQSLMDMGFTRQRAEVAIWSTSPPSVEAAMEWLINHPEPEAGQAAGADAELEPILQGGKRKGVSEATRSSVASELATSLSDARSDLLQCLVFVGARVQSSGQGAIVELATRLASLPTVL